MIHQGNFIKLVRCGLKDFAEFERDIWKMDGYGCSKIEYNQEKGVWYFAVYEIKRPPRESNPMEAR